MKLNFKLSEFNISGEPIPEKVADKILKYHIAPMQDVREDLGYAIYPSLKSGFRSVWWEKTHGRSGSSQHTFIENGAVDWTCHHFKRRKDRLLESMIKHTDYTRFAIYSGFIHADYKNKSGNVQIFANEFDSEKEEWKWKLIKTIDF